MLKNQSLFWIRCYLSPGLRYSLSFRMILLKIRLHDLPADNIQKTQKNDNTDCFYSITAFRTLPSSATCSPGKSFHPTPDALTMFLTSHFPLRAPVPWSFHCTHTRCLLDRSCDLNSSAGTIFVLICYSPGGSTSLSSHISGTTSSGWTSCANLLISI